MTTKTTAQSTIKRSFILFLLLFSNCLTANDISKNSPLSWKGYALVEDVSNLHGGRRTGSILTAAGDLEAIYDTGIANWWDGGKFLIGVLGIAQTHNQTLYTGAIQTPSSYSAVPLVRISYLAYEQNIKDVFTARAGIMDIDDYFNITEVAINICNTAFYNTIALSANAQLPTYPFPGFGAMVDIGNKTLDFKLGLFQGNPQHQSSVFHRGYLLIGELDTTYDTQNKYSLEYIFKLGLWKYHQPIDWVGYSDRGIYGIAEATWKSKDHNMSAAIQFGADPKLVNSVPDSVAGCFIITNLIPTRNNDSLNLALGRAWIQDVHNETFFEAGYTIVLTDKWSFTPDLQYFIKPGGIYDNAWVFIARLLYTL
jgi:porin